MPIIVSARIENLADVYEAGRGLGTTVRQVEAPDARVVPGVVGLLVPSRLVGRLGLDPIEGHWTTRTLTRGRPIPHWPVRLTIRGRQCVMDVGAVADHLPVMIGMVPLGAMDWVADWETGQLIGNPEHDGEEMYDLF